MNILIDVFWRTNAHVFRWIHTQEWKCEVIQCAYVQPNSFPKLLYQLALPAVMQDGGSCSTSLLTRGKVCFIFGGLCGGCLTVVLFCISLMTRDIEHLFRYWEIDHSPVDSDQRPFEDNFGPGQLLLIMKQIWLSGPCAEVTLYQKRGLKLVWPGPTGRSYALPLGPGMCSVAGWRTPWRKKGCNS